MSYDYRSLSLWHETCGDELKPRHPLPGNISVDVAILGAGFTGLWTALYLKRARPDLEIAVLEKEIAGFGASGRNGGWCSALFPWAADQLAKTYGVEQAQQMRRAMIDSVDEVGRICHELNIDGCFNKAGTYTFIRGKAQKVRATAELESAKKFGIDQLELLRNESAPRASETEGVVYDPNCASVHPAKLVRGLARAVEEIGVRIFEQTEVIGYEAGKVATSLGEVRSRYIVEALEGYRSNLRQSRRDSIPIYSLMIATEPLSDRLVDSLALPRGATFADFRHLLIYGQLTSDNRIAFGGRGAPYHFGSKVRPEYDRVPGIFSHLERELRALFPQLQATNITHRWGGALGIPRDWHAGVYLDSQTGVGRAGGYVGDGVGATNLAGRTMRDLILGEKTALTALPWVNHRSPRWEPEPLRFFGARGGVLAAALSDRLEKFTGKPTLISKILGSLTGKI